MTSTEPDPMLAAVLQRAEAGVLKRREVEMDAIAVLLEFADACSGTPKTSPTRCRSSTAAPD